jgi:hypothetical protein
MTNYTTLKLTEDQVRALLSAMTIYEMNSEGLDEDELEEYGYNENIDHHEQIRTKLRKSGWNV